MGKVWKVILIVLGVLVFALVIGLIVRFTSNGNSVFSVEVGGQTFSAEGEYVLEKGDNRFETSYIYSDGEMLHGGYTLSVVPDEENDFWFTADGKDEKLSEVDLSDALDISSDETGFTITYDGASVSDILSRALGGKEVVLDDGFDFDRTFVKLVISSADGKNVVEIGLFLNVPATGVELDKEGIIF